MNTRSRISSKNAYKNNLSTLDDVDLSGSRNGSMMVVSSDTVVPGPKIFLSSSEPEGNSGDIWLRIEKTEEIPTSCDPNGKETNLTTSTTYKPSQFYGFWNSYADLDNIQDSTFSSFIVEYHSAPSNYKVTKETRNIDNDLITEKELLPFQHQFKIILYSDQFIYTEHSGSNFASLMQIVDIETEEVINITNHTDFYYFYSATSFSNNGLKTTSGDIWAILPTSGDSSVLYICKLEGTEFVKKFDLSTLPNYDTSNEKNLQIAEDLTTGDLFLTRGKYIAGGYHHWFFYKLDQNGVPISPNTVPRYETGDNTAVYNNVFYNNDFLLFESMSVYGNGSSYRIYKISDWHSDYLLSDLCNSVQTGNYSNMGNHEYAKFIWLGDQHIIGQRKVYDGQASPFPGLFHMLFPD